MNILKWILATPDDWFLIIVSMQALDIGFGLAKAYRQRDFSSRKMKFGILLKALVIGAFFVFDFVAYRFNPAAVPYVACGLGLYISLMELWSMVENADKAGVPLPTWLKELIHKESENKADKVFDIILTAFNLDKNKKGE